MIAPCPTCAAALAQQQHDSRALTAHAVFLATADAGDLARLEHIARTSLDEREVHRWVVAWVAEREAAASGHMCTEECRTGPSQLTSPQPAVDLRTVLSEAADAIAVVMDGCGPSTRRALSLIEDGLRAALRRQP